MKDLLTEESRFKTISDAGKLVDGVDTLMVRLKKPQSGMSADEFSAAMASDSKYVKKVGNTWVYTEHMPSPPLARKMTEVLTSVDWSTTSANIMALAIWAWALHHYFTN